MPFQIRSVHGHTVGCNCLVWCPDFSARMHNMKKERCPKRYGLLRDISYEAKNSKNSGRFLNILLV